MDKLFNCLKCFKMFKMKKMCLLSGNFTSHFYFFDMFIQY